VAVCHACQEATLLRIDMLEQRKLFVGQECAIGLFIARAIRSIDKPKQLRLRLFGFLALHACAFVGARSRGA